MAISHLCMTCGDDLTRVRAPLDPHYRLPVVVCPSCATAVVRRTHPIWRKWRFLQRLFLAIVAMVLQVAAIAFFTSIASVLCYVLGDETIGGLVHIEMAGELLGLVFAFGVFPFLLGLWLSAGLEHWNRVVAWSVFAGFVALILAMDVIVAPTIQLILARLELVDPELVFDWGLFFTRLRLLFVIMTVACAGIPARRVIHSFASHMRRLSWRLRRRRLRQRSITG